VRRHDAGALSFQTVELHPVMSTEGSVLDLATRQQNRASYIIEDFMIASNQATAGFLDERDSRASVVWCRFRRAGTHRGTGGVAWWKPSCRAGWKEPGDFLQTQLKSNPNICGSFFGDHQTARQGRIRCEVAGRSGAWSLRTRGSQLLAFHAPNRRYPELITQRLLKAAIAGKKNPYSTSELVDLARHCTEKEDDANKVERFVRKCAAATLLASRIGQKFSAWSPEFRGWNLGTIIVSSNRRQACRSARDLDVGDSVHVRLIPPTPKKASSISS